MQRANKAEGTEEGGGIEKERAGAGDWDIAVAQQQMQLVAKLGIEIIVI